MKIYLDTSVISALYDVRTPERQEMTRVAWARLDGHEVFLSQTVIDELNNAPFQLREKMLAVVSPFTVLPVSAAAGTLANIYVGQGIFPKRYFDDALHVAIASVNNIGVLLSWNFSHLVKLNTRRMVALVNAVENHMPVEIISPPEL